MIKVTQSGEDVLSTETRSPESTTAPEPQLTHGPQLVAEVQDAAIDLRGFVVVDSNVNGHACGGLRFFSDVTREQVASLAHGMTLKYGFSGTAQGGAKAGIIGDPDMPMQQKQRLVARFGELIAPLLKTGYYISGPDMSITPEDIDVLLTSARLKVPRGRRKKGKKSGYFTALSVMVAAETAAAERGIDLSKATMAIEGFGSVGSALGWLMSHKHGTKVVAVSTTKGAIYAREGLDMGRLFDLRREFGNDVVLRYDRAERIDNEALILLDVDMVSPCARQYAISTKNASQLRARLVVPGANNPVSDEAELVLQQRGIVSVPYFAANCGGVLGNRMEVLGVSDMYIEEYFRARNSGRIRQVLQRAASRGIPPSVLAEEYAMRRFIRTKAYAEKFSAAQGIYRTGLHIVRQGWLPESVLRFMAPSYFGRGAELDKSIDLYLS